MTENTQSTGWTTGFLPNGAKASFTLVISDPMNAYTEMLAFTNKLLADGFLLVEPGLEAGEHKEQVNALVRRAKVNKDDTVTPVIDLYVGRNNFSFLRVYLNTWEETRAFEQACGVTLDSMAVYEGDSAIERGKSPDKDRKYVVRLDQPATVAYIHNPDYVEGGKKEPKRLFQRWLGIATESHHNTPNFNAAPESPVSTPEWDMTRAFDKSAVDDLCAFYGVDLVRAALGINNKWSEWTAGFEAAVIAIDKWQVDF